MAGQHHSHEEADPHSGHDHAPGQFHGHTHGVVDPTIITTGRGIWAIKWSFIGLLLTSLFQLVVVCFSGSIALLADTIHNFGDAATAVPLWIAFLVARWQPTRRFTYGYGRVEDLAGVTIVLIILASAVSAGYMAVERFLHPQPMHHLRAVGLAALIGFAGNEAVAVFRIKVGKEIHSAALIADGYHARVDGFTSLAVLLGVAGAWLGYPLVDPIVALLITVAILGIVRESATAVFSRLLDGVDPEVLDEIIHAVNHVPGVLEVTEVRVRWLGHRLHAELNIAVSEALSVVQGHDIAHEVRHQLLHHLSYLSNATIHVDPVTASGEQHHRIEAHAHGDLPVHSH